jgi:SAM-dependent methyltransferase
MINKAQIICPLCGDSKIRKIKTIRSQDLIKRYANDFGINVSEVFTGLSNIELFKCNVTGYNFFYPLNIAGDAKFYEKLQEFPWYYMPWKWEHEQVFRAIQKLENPKVLEIGCAQGSFLKRLAETNIECVGLELNKDAVKIANENRLTVFDATIQQHAASRIEYYDVVCSFQVMEHIGNIKEVLEASIQTLKKGGFLYISVPNNNSFLGLDADNLLNMPPHHMCLWDATSLGNLCKVFNIKECGFMLEPQQNYHINWYNSVIKNTMNEKRKEIVKKIGYTLGKRYFNLMYNILYKKLLRNYPELKNVTIVAVFTKL